MEEEEEEEEEENNKKRANLSFSRLCTTFTSGHSVGWIQSRNQKTLHGDDIPLYINNLANSVSQHSLLYYINDLITAVSYNQMRLSFSYHHFLVNDSPYTSRTTHTRNVSPVTYDNLWWCVHLRSSYSFVNISSWFGTSSQTHTTRRKCEISSSSESFLLTLPSSFSLWSTKMKLFFFFLLYIFYLALLCVSTYFVIRKEKNKQNKRNVCWVYNSSCARPPLSMYFPSHVTRAAAQQRKYIRFSTTRQILSLHGNTTFRVHVASSWVYIYIHLFFCFRFYYSMRMYLS